MQNVCRMYVLCLNLIVVLRAGHFKLSFGSTWFMTDHYIPVFNHQIQLAIFIKYYYLVMCFYNPRNLHLTHRVWFICALERKTSESTDYNGSCGIWRIAHPTSLLD